MTGALLSVRDLTVRYGSGGRHDAAVCGLDFDVNPGEAVALVGESGCGKSTTALALMGLLPASARVEGTVLFGGRNLNGLPERAFRRIRGREIGMIFQEPMTSLNPVHTIGDQIAEVLHAHTDMDRRGVRERVLELLERVAIPDPARRIDAYPHELSGGQRQRVVIAMAIALNPRLLIADEPTTALDSTIQRQILQLLDGLRRDLGTALVLISHDLPVVARWTDRVVVMHHGREMERLESASLFEQGQHPYTRGLISASIRLSDERHYTTGRLTEIRALPAPGGDVAFELHQPPVRPGSAPALDASPILAIENLVVDYQGGRDAPRAVDGVSLTVARGETLGLVGESGSGKSSLAKAAVRLIDPAGGRILFDGEDVTHLRDRRLRDLRRRVQTVFQDPFASLNPRQTVGDILNGVLALHGMTDSVKRARAVAACLDQVGLPRDAVQRFPHEFSGGQRQRVGIARALILRPSLVVCDEPVSALDVSIQAQILNLLIDLKQEFGLSYLFISHDLAVVQYISDHVAVMQKGRIVEKNDRLTIWRDPAHPYTRSLIGAVA